MLRSLIFYAILLTACAESADNELIARALDTAAAAAGGGASSDGGTLLTAGSCGAIDSAFVTTYPDAGPCDDSPVAHSATWQDHRGQYIVTCDSLPAGSRGCTGIPSDLWGRCNLRRCESTEVYPEGCTLYMPTENRWYPGAPQSCSCQVVPGVSEPPRWTCGI